MKKKITTILFLRFLAVQLLAQEITDKEKSDVLNNVIKIIQKIYPFPEISSKTISGLKEQISIGFYNKINSAEYDGVATISPDGKYLFYCHNHDIYWVDAKIIEELKAKK